ncbi:MAG: PQQ-binding-like beta-propeller repeat protein [Planctomycetales bacterium]|nr:PQQ-binding-like beta-propeller repeat protein [Planctomycetales bacterium]
MPGKRIIVAFALTACVALAIASVLYFRSLPRRPRLDDPHARPLVQTDQEQSTTDSSLVLENARDQPPWGRFRGPNGTGISEDSGIPLNWDDHTNLQWKAPLPGYGASSPVLTKDFVFVTCYSGYGTGRTDSGSPQDLTRHVVCVARSSGDILWTRDYPNAQREDPYQGMGLPEHGYATNTATTDGQTLFAFLGKSGVVALNLDGEQLWQASVGTSSGNRGWGSAASLMLYDDLLIVNAAEESHSIVALEKSTGREVWKSEASTLELSYGTPAIVRVDEQREDLVLAVPGEVWGMNPRTGRLVWFVQSSLTDNLSPSVIVDGNTVYAFGGYRSSGSLAIKVGGTGNVTDSAILWTSRNSSYVATPVLVDRSLYWIDDRGMYYCANADTGELIHRARTPGISGGQHPVYASPIAVNGKILAQTRASGMIVLEASDKLSILSHNTFAADSSNFNATPAADAGQLFLRSDQYLYCISKLASNE